MRNIRQNRGITLIALVITIIVLLILAGVVIASLTGENGILNRAADAKEDTAEAQAKEEIQLAILESMAEKNGYDKADIINKLTKLGATVTENGDTLTVEYKGYTFIVDAKGTVTGSNNNNNTTGSKPTVADIGKEVAYGVDLDGNSATNDWKIFYATDSGTYIIASDYVPYSNSTLQTAMDSSHANMDNYANYETNQGTATTGYPYSAYWPTASYLTQTTYDTNAATYFMNDWTTVSYNNAKAAASLCNTTAWAGFTNGISGAYAVGGPTLELYRASWNAKTYTEGTHTKLQITKRADSTPYGYYVTANNDDSTTATTTYVSMSGDAGYNDTLYYPHQSAESNCYGYWLASPSADDGIYVMRVHCNGDVGNDDYGYNHLGVRPVVYLPSNVQLTEDNEVWTVES